MKTGMRKVGVGTGLAIAALAAQVLASHPAVTVKCRAELDREILPANAAQRAVVKITLDAPKASWATERPPINLAIALDRSGSMAGAKLEKAKEAAIEVLRRLNARDRFALVVYDSDVETIVPSQSAGNTEWIIPRIREINSRGSTALFSGVSQAAAEIRKNLSGDYIHRVILLSDGQANVGPRSADDLGRLGAAFFKEHIAVTTVGVGTDYNEDLMTRLAQNSDGNTYFVEESRELPRIFAAELGDVLSVVARQVRIEIDFVNGARPLRIIGRDGRVSGKRVELSLNQLYGGQEKYVLVEVDLAPGRPHDVLRIVEARCTYENADGGRTDTARAYADARFSAVEEEVIRSVNVTVQNDLILNTIAEAKDEAIRLTDKGDKKQAADLLRNKADEIAKRTVTYKINLSADQQAAITSMPVAAVTIEREGMSKGTRKAYMTESYQDRNQQRAR